MSSASAPSGPHHERRHGVVDHTADVGIEAAASDPAALLEEAAAALAELMASVAATPARPATTPVAVDADDLTALAFGWLSELVSLADARGEALIGGRVDTLESTAGGWSLRGTATFVPYGKTVVPRAQVKAATFHRMRVEPDLAGWVMEAYFDV